MHRDLALLCAALVLAGATASLVRLRATVGWATIAASLLWLPLNNQVLEGPVLLTVTNHHGITLADLLGLAGVAVGAVTAWPRSSWRPGWPTTARISTLTVLVMLAYLAAAAETDFSLHGRDRTASFSSASTVK